MNRVMRIMIVSGFVAFLGGCGSTGNFTDYIVRCGKPDSEVRNIAWSVARTIGNARNKELKIWQNTSQTLQIVISDGPIFDVLYISPKSGEPVPPDWGYTASVTRLWSKTEDAEVSEARKLVETAIQRSACPVYEKRVRYYHPQSLSN
jgi:hypothetical protein